MSIPSVHANVTTSIAKGCISMWDDFDYVYELCSEYLTEDEMKAIDVHTDICGNTVNNIDDCIYVMFGYRSFKQYYESELKY